MYVYVRLLNGFSKPLLYQVPDSLATVPLLHRIIEVPLQKRTEFAFVYKVVSLKPFATFEIRDIKSLVVLPQDEHYDQFIGMIASYYQTDRLTLLHRLQSFFTTREDHEDEVVNHEQQVRELTHAQQEVAQQLVHAVSRGGYMPHVLHGVTGAGKTEVYGAIMTAALAQGKSVILLCPEVSLALQIAARITKLVPSHIPVFQFHSSVKKDHKDALWRQLCDRKPLVVVGVHLPILLPIPNLGCIIVDEEHEVGYQEKKHPKLNTKDIALMRAHHYKLPIILGSATPSITSLYNVHKRGWPLLQLTERFKGSFPAVQVVCLDKEKREHFFISRELKNALADRLEKKEQSILFLNRRGYSFFVQCDTCATIMQCTSCSVSLTLHEDGMLRCHYCAYEHLCPSLCTACPKGSLKRRGIGTQQVVEIIKKMFPDARVGRADLDVTSAPARWKKTLADFESGNLDILVGTQTIAKGHHFPRVTLVGVIWADVNLHFPVYNAQEVALQQLLQVIGRSGRMLENSMAIVQTIDDHAVYEFLDERTYPSFYEQEIMTRELIGYPPCMRFAELEFVHDSEAVVAQDALACVQFIRSKIDDTVQVLGPALPPVSKIKNTHRRRVYIKAAQAPIIHELARLVKARSWKSTVYYTPNPLS